MQQRLTLPPWDKACQKRLATTTATKAKQRQHAASEAGHDMIAMPHTIARAMTPDKKGDVRMASLETCRHCWQNAHRPAYKQEPCQGSHPTNMAGMQRKWWNNHKALPEAAAYADYLGTTWHQLDNYYTRRQEPRRRPP